MYQDWGSEGVRYNTYRDAGWGRSMSDQAKICISRSGSLTEQARILVERVSLDVFVGDSALLEGYPAFLSERAELGGVSIGGDKSSGGKGLPNRRAGRVRSRPGGC